MIDELARLTIDPAKAADFEAAVGRCVHLFQRAKGCRSMVLEREIETPGRYILRVGWDSVADHMTCFRATADFQRWRDAVGPFFVAPPEVCHTETATTGF